MMKIDINCDLGEAGFYDTELMPLISSCNIACGGHSGDSNTIATAVRLAILKNVRIGAHPSYPDLVNFGRKSMEISLSDLGRTLLEQMKRVYDETKNQKLQLHHVKAHGALYNDLRTDLHKSNMFVEQILTLDDQLIVLTPPNSALQEVAKGRLKVMTEGFADRRYDKNFMLVSREIPGAVLQEKTEILNQVLSMVKEGRIYLENGTILTAKFDSICVHSDTQNSLGILQFLNRELLLNNIQISSR